MLRTSSFRQGPAITDTLQYLRSQGDSLCATAVKHFQRLCKTNDVPVLQTPPGTELLSASWIEETEPARLLFRSRHSDLVVLGRPRNEDYMPGGLIESIFLGSGRPVVLAPESMPRSATGRSSWGGRKRRSGTRTRSLATAPSACEPGRAHDSRGRGRRILGGAARPRTT